MIGGTVEAFDKVFLWITAISVVVLIGITLVMLYFVFRYSRKRNPIPSHIHGNLWAETLWTVIPTIIFIGMFFYGLEGLRALRTVPDEAMTVHVKGQMWKWTYTYENGATADTLYVPVGQPVKLLITSADVLHSFYIPRFRVKEDAVPGRTTYLWFEATEPGISQVFCAEYCGLLHSAMLSSVEAVPREEFDAWVEQGAEAVAEEEAAVEDGGETEAADPVEAGRQLVSSGACLTCHTLDGTSRIGPTFKGLYGRTTELESGESITVDADYIKRSLREPSAQIVKGFQPVMPPQDFSDRELDQIVAFLESGL